MKPLRYGLVPRDARPMDMLAIGGLAIVAFVLGSIAWPLYPGRDSLTYLMYYLEMGRPDPVFPLLMLFRTPGAPLFYGVPLAAGAPVVAEVLSGICYVVAIIAGYLSGCFWGRRTGTAVAAVLLAYSGYNAIFHNVSADGPYVFGIAVWMLMLCSTAAEPTARKFVLHGLALFALTMVRPSSQLLFGFLFLFALLLSEPLRKKLRFAAIAILTGGSLVVGWAGYNKARYGNFTISRLSATIMPLSRLMILDHLVRPENGPASRALADAVESDLLRKEPYRSYGVTRSQFFRNGQILMWSDVAGLSDRVWGWESNYRVPKAAAREAIVRNPARYAKGVAAVFVKTMLASYTPLAPAWPPLRHSIRCNVGCFQEGTVEVNGKELPRPFYPSEGIPSGNTYWLESTPDTSVTTDWSVLTSPRFSFRDPRKRLAFESLSAGLADQMRLLPPRPAAAAVTRIMNWVTTLLPSMWLWSLIGVIGVWYRRPKNLRLVLFLWGTAVGGVLINALGLPATPEYRVPFDPLIILFGVIGLVGGTDRCEPPSRRTANG